MPKFRFYKIYKHKIIPFTQYHELKYLGTMPLRSDKLSALEAKHDWVIIE